MQAHGAQHGVKGVLFEGKRLLVAVHHKLLDARWGGAGCPFGPDGPDCSVSSACPDGPSSLARSL